MPIIRKPDWSFLFLTFIVTLTASVSAQDWSKHRQVVSENPDLIRYYVFDESVAETKTVKNLAPRKDVENSDLSYRTKHPFETVDGPFAGTRAARLDAGFFESAKVDPDKIGKSFSLELRVRKSGYGLERGNSGATNGTLFGLGNGYDNGIRLTTDYPNRFLVFSIGRPENPKARNVVGDQPIPDGCWQHIACSWDGETMRIYVDGILYAINDFDGVLTDPCWGFRVGFNDAGVGSVKMDVAEVAFYKSALPPEEVMQHALLEAKFPEQHASLLRDAIVFVAKKDFPAAGRELEKLLALKMPQTYRFALRKFEADIAAMSKKTGAAKRMIAGVLADPNLPESMADALRRRLVSSDFIAPVAVASSGTYRKILDDPSIELDARQRLAAEKCLAESLFAEGRFDEAKKVFDETGPKEIGIMNEILSGQKLSGEPTDLFRQYRKEQEINLKTAWEKPAQNQPLPDSFKPARTIYVAPDGKADNPGTESSPLGSLLQARDAVRKIRVDGKLPDGGVEIVVRRGIYSVTETFLLDSQDSGTERSPIVYRAFPDEKPVFSGGVTCSDFKPADDPAVLERLPADSHGKVYVAQVPAGSEFPPVAPRGYGKNGLGAAPSVELFVDDKPQQIARWPNAARPNEADPLKASEKAFVKVGKVHQGFFNSKESGKPGIFEYADPRHERWLQAADAMLFGYWGHLWGITSCKIATIDTAAKRVVLATNNPYGYRENMPYYAFNLLEEIDEPGEWYLDRQAGRLYVYPPIDTDLNTRKVRLSRFPKDFVRLNDVSFTTFLGLTFEEGTGNGAIVSGGESVQFVDCRFYRFGKWGIGLRGLRHGVSSCDFQTLGGGGIRLDGGTIKTLEPGGCFVRNTVVHDFSRVDRAYAPAVQLEGVGNRLANNLFCDSPAQAIRVEGMDHLIEFNEIHSVVYESDDQSGIDIWGNPYIRGMVFRYNYWHHIGSGRDVAGQAGIRLDDMISSVMIYGNVFLRASGGQFGGVQIHGGKDTIVADNLMIDCKYAVSFSPWGEKRWLENLEKNFGPTAVKKGFDPESEIYRTKYPDYADLKLNADRNIIVRNAAIACENFAHNNRKNLSLENVSIPWMSALFTETRSIPDTGNSRVPSEARKIRGRLSIPPDSPLYGFLGIRPLPIARMGLYLDGIRKEIPAPPVTPFFVQE